MKTGFREFLTEIQASIVTYNSDSIAHYKKWNKSAGKQVIGIDGQMLNDSIVLSPSTTAIWNMDGNLEITTVESGKQPRIILTKQEAETLKKIL